MLKSFVVESPAGSKVRVTNLNAFCKDVFGSTNGGNGMYESSFRDLLAGRRKEATVMGWTKARGIPRTATKYTLVSPSGSKVVITNIEAFCKDVFGLSNSGRGRFLTSFNKMLNEETKGANSVEGWTRG